MSDKYYERYFNKTFNIGNINTNACVGRNGEPDHITFGYGYDEAAKLMIKAAKNFDAALDTIIYPLVFCARHRIELFLKDQLITLELTKPYKGIRETEKFIRNTHDLNELWKAFKLQSEKTDRRLFDFINQVEQEEYIKDFAEIDPTGQVFRYPFDKKNNRHLANTPIINVEILEERYELFSELMDDFEYFSEYLLMEYRQKTYTKNLSRNDIYEISLAINNIQEFDKRTKEQIKKQYCISSNELSKAVNIIKNHREFCVNIGEELILPQIDSKQLLFFINIYKQKTDREASINMLKQRLNNEIVSMIYSLFDFGKFGDFSEQFDFFYKRYKVLNSEDSVDIAEYCAEMLMNINTLKHIEKALNKLGQKTLLELCFSK